MSEIKKGESVGYNRGFIADKNTKVGIVPIGHADGISRKLGNRKGKLVVNDVHCDIIGNVCMDMLMVDVTNIPCKPGDTAVIFDQQHGAQNLAEGAGTISYELLTGLSKRIKRSFLSE